MWSSSLYWNRLFIHLGSGVDLSVLFAGFGFQSWTIFLNHCCFYLFHGVGRFSSCLFLLGFCSQLNLSSTFLVFFFPFWLLLHLDSTFFSCIWVSSFSLVPFIAFFSFLFPLVSDLKLRVSIDVFGCLNLNCYTVIAWFLSDSGWFLEVRLNSRNTKES